MRSFKNKVKNDSEVLAGTANSPVLSRGIDLIKDIDFYLPRYRVDVVFDVGANIGQSANSYLAGFPDSCIYCFEPVSYTFHRLQDNFKNNERIECYQFAFGSLRKKGKMVIQGDF